MGSIPNGFESCCLDPANPTGHDQTLTFYTDLNSLAFDPENRMSKLKSDVYLRYVLLPGSKLFAPGSCNT
jgi:hypothetical protein